MDMYRKVGIIAGLITLLVGVSSTPAPLFLRLSSSIIGILLLGICLIIPDTSGVKTRSPLPLQYEQLNQSSSPLDYQVKLEKIDEMILNPAADEQLIQSPTSLPYQAKLEQTDETKQDPTAAETQMWKILKTNVMPFFPEHVFQFQYVHHVQRGYILDFYCPSLSLVIELDDDSHDIERGYDWESESNLKGKEVEVVRVSNSEVLFDPVEVAMSICKIIEEKIRALTPS